MKCLKTIYVFSIALLLGLATYRPAIASDTCHTTLTSGSCPNYMQVCISNHSNLIVFKFPNTNLDNIADEGYVICDNPGGAEFVSGCDTGASEAGCGSPTLVQPNGANTLPLTITRSCHCITFKQVFSRDTTEKDITITMTLKNTCSFSLSDVKLARYFDGDISGDATDDLYSTSANSIWGRDLQDGTVLFGLMLSVLTFGTSNSTHIETFANWNPNGDGDQSARRCSPGSFFRGNTSAGDFVGGLLYFLGNLSPNQSKTVKVVYERK